MNIRKMTASFLVCATLFSSTIYESKAASGESISPTLINCSKFAPIINNTNSPPEPSSKIDTPTISIESANSNSFATASNYPRTYKYDAGDRLLSTQLSSGKTLTYQYDLNGNTISKKPLLKAMGQIEDFENGKTVHGLQSVGGWFLHPSGVSKVEYFINGNYWGNASYGQSREDIYQAFPEFKEHNSGFVFTFNSYQLENGSYTLTVRFTGRDNTTIEENRSFIVNVLPQRGEIESPYNGGEFKGTLPVKGWLLDGAGVKKIELIIEGPNGTRTVHNPNYGQPREDIYDLWYSYRNGCSGFQTDINILYHPPGTYTLYVYEVGNNDKVFTMTRTFTIPQEQKPPGGGGRTNPTEPPAS
ncbi:Ig-like domain-containing protein [Paenibacillus ehimensis]|uniref:Ig-like domain-containing protein n=1 Tax=Paenibacillus ehimensis TaxID=79264 RepID=UPI000470D2F2|nr:Ig-like domain-containing protein [Paenibacillus ehimensis]